MTRVSETHARPSSITDPNRRRPTEHHGSDLMASDAYAEGMAQTQLFAGPIYTIGYEGRTVQELLHELVRNGVELLVDVRLTPLSRKKGFSKNALAAALRDVGVEYRHQPGLGNPKDNREAFRKGHESARARYRTHVTDDAQPVIDETIEMAQHQRVALLCFEREHSECHRSCITEIAQAAHPALSVRRL
jgi:hypothetical protein